jgi:site-specific DNA recombinase
MAKKSKMLKISQPDDLQRKIALYLRVSTDRQAEEGYSIEVQRERLEAYVVAKYGKTADYDFFVDDGYSGGSLERPEMQRMIEAVEEGNITDVIVYKLDRLSRSQKDTLYLIEDVFLAHNVAFSSLQESFDTSTPFGRAVVGILSVFAQLERENIYERTRSGMRKRVEAGYWPGGGGTPFGYDYDSGTGILIPNADAEKVKNIFELYVQGVGMQAIANMMDLDYETLIHQILTRKTYLGKIVYNGVEYQGMHEPLVSEELFGRVQSLLRDRNKRKPNLNPKYILTGLCYCGKCGAKMRYQKWGKYGTKMVCYSQQHTKLYLIKDPNCDNIKPWADEIEAAVLEDLFRFGQSIEDIQPQEKKATVLDTLKIKKAGLEAKRKKLIKLFAVSDDSMEAELKEELAQIKEDLADLEDEIAEEEEKSTLRVETGDIRAQIKTIRDLWPKMSLFSQQEFLRNAIDRIEVTDYHIKIDYKF